MGCDHSEGKMNGLDATVSKVASSLFFIKVFPASARKNDYDV